MSAPFGLQGISSGQVQLYVTVIRCQHLPHRDPMSDLRWSSSIQGTSSRPTACLKEPSPDLVKTFVLPVMRVQEPSEITLEVQDWEQSSKQDMIGTYVIKKEDLSTILRAEFDGSGHPVLQLVGKEGNAVLHPNKVPHVITIKFKTTLKHGCV